MRKHPEKEKIDLENQNEELITNYNEEETKRADKGKFPKWKELYELVNTIINLLEKR